MRFQFTVLSKEINVLHLTAGVVRMRLLRSISCGYRGRNNVHVAKPLPKCKVNTLLQAWSSYRKRICLGTSDRPNGRVIDIDRLTQVVVSFKVTAC